MKFILFNALSLLCIQSIYAQKLNVSDTTFKSWAYVDAGVISHDGKYASYHLNNDPQGKKTFVVLSTDKKWERQFTSYQSTKFSEDSKSLYAIQTPNILVKLTLGTDKVSEIAHCNSYQLLNSNKGNWLAYQIADSVNTLIIQNLKSNKRISVDGVQDFLSCIQGNFVLAICKDKNDTTETLLLIDLVALQSKKIYTGTNTGQYIFDDTGDKIAFIISQENNKRVMCYSRRKNSVDSFPINDPSVYGKMQISTSPVWRFTSDSKSLLFCMEPLNDTVKFNRLSVIWNYKDAYLPKHFKSVLKSSKIGKNLSCIDLETGKFRQLLSGSQKVNGIGGRTDAIIAYDEYGVRQDVPWNTNIARSYYLVFPTSGSIDTVKFKHRDLLDNMKLSPDRRYLIYSDPMAQQYFSYDTYTKRTINLSKNISDDLNVYSLPDRGMVNYGMRGIAGWVRDQNRVIIKGKYHLLLVDPSGKQKPVNFTKKFDETSNIIYNLEKPDYEFNSNQNILVSGFNIDSKVTKIYRVNFSKNTWEEVLTTTDYFDQLYFGMVAYFIKARDAFKYLYKTEQVNRNPNYIFTDEFRRFDTLTYVHPEAKYNWITSEVIKYKDKRGQDCEAILYKPENFDPTKKYPVLINYYTDQVTKVNKFISPEPAAEGINIPLLLSNGYLIIKPDIYLEPGNAGPSALNSVMALTDFISTLPWIDSTRVAVSGHSFGAWETNYIITHTNRFAAAITSAGVSNLVDNVAGTWVTGVPKAAYVIKGPYRMLKELNDDAGAYIDASPIFNTATLNTPLLMIHNPEDTNVPVLQGEQFFIQLRREGKPAWLIQYEGEGHLISDEKNQLDAQVKVLDFLNYYLKGMGMPKWMADHN